MAQEGDWIYNLDEELHERLRGRDLDALTDETIARILVALSLSRIALTFEQMAGGDCLQVRNYVEGTEGG